VCRSLHFFATTAVTIVFWAAIGVGDLRWWVALPLIGYGPAWLGHFVFERNRPASFGHPAWSLLCDWILWKDIWIGRIPLTGTLPEKHWTDSQAA
jgi:hypothetical protein